MIAQPGSVIVPNVGPLRHWGLITWKPLGFKVWVQSTIQTVHLDDYPDLCAPVIPVRLTGVRNGTFSGQIMVRDEEPIRGLRVVGLRVERTGCDTSKRGPGALCSS